MPEMGFEPTIRVFERAKKVHALDRAATLVGIFMYCGTEMKLNAVRPVEWTLPSILVILQSVSPWLLGCRCRQLRKCVRSRTLRRIGIVCCAMLIRQGGADEDDVCVICKLAYTVVVWFEF
jgi:hypothetical protein